MSQTPFEWVKDAAKGGAVTNTATMTRAIPRQLSEQLTQASLTDVVNLAGGILAWSDEIDPKVQKY